MTDYTREITALQRARIEMQVEQKTNAVTIKAKYAERIRQEIADADEAAKLRFARLLADAHAAGVPQSLLRTEVLRTNAWDRWVYWRDLADIEPERVTIRNAKEEREAENRRATQVYEWQDGVLYVHRNPATGEALPHVLAYPLYNAKGAHVPYQYNELSALEWVTGDRKTGIDLAFAISDEIKRAFRDEEITVSTHPYDYVNDLDEGLRDEYLTTEDNKFIAANPWLDDYTKETHA